MMNYTTTTLTGIVATPASVTEYSLDNVALLSTSFKIDATYDPTSENAQSGVAVAEALKTVVIPVDLTYNATSENAQSGKAVAEALTTVAIPVDATYDATSANPQAGTAVAQALDTLSVRWDATKGSIRMGTATGTPVAIGTVEIGTAESTNAMNSVAIGVGSACREGSSAVAIGQKSRGVSHNSVAIGYISRAHLKSVSIGSNCYNQIKYGTAVGANAKTGADACMALGYATNVADAGVTCISAWDSTDLTTQTQFYLIGAGSSLATTYEEGEACLGYVVKDTAGNIIERGTRKLSELLTNNTNVAAASLDPDAPEPTPFTPTGITEPIVFEEPEELIPTDQPTE